MLRDFFEQRLAKLKRAFAKKKKFIKCNEDDAMLDQIGDLLQKSDPVGARRLVRKYLSYHEDPTVYSTTISGWNVSAKKNKAGGYAINFDPPVVRHK